MSLLIFIYFIFFAWLSWRRLDWALMIIIFALWSYLIRFTVLGLPSTLLELMILTVFVAWLIRNTVKILSNVKNNFQSRKINRRYPFDWEIVFLLIISLVAVAVAGWSSSALGAWKAYFFEPIVFFLIVFNVIGKDRAYGKIIYPLALSSIGLSLIALWQRLTGSFVVPEFWTKLAERATSIFPYPNALGLYLAPLILLFLGWLIYVIKSEEKNKWLKVGLLGLAVFFSSLAVYLAESDGALVGLAVAVIIFIIMSNKKLAIAMTILLIIAGTIIYNNQPVYNKLKDKLTLFDLSGQIRQQQWKETWTMLKDNNLIAGVGLSNYQIAVKPYHQAGIFVKNHDPQWLSKVLNNSEYNKQAWQPTEIYLYPHNIFLNFWTELGLAGVLLFVWIIIKYIVLAFKNIFSYNYQSGNKYMTLGLLGAMIVIMVHGLVDVPYLKNDLSVLFWLLLSLLGMIYVHNKQDLY